MNMIMVLTSWWCLLSTTVGLQVSGRVDEFAYIPKNLLSDYLKKIFVDPDNLGNLLRVQETQEYGIYDLISQSCLDWSMEEWKRIKMHVKDRPKLASLLVSSKCLELLYDACNSEEIQSNSTVKERYNFARELAPLPFLIENHDDLTKILKNIQVVHRFALQRWLIQTEFEDLVFRLHNDRRILESGLTHYFLAPMLPEDLNNLNTRNDYFSMLMAINRPAELFGHAVRLKSLMHTIKLDYEQRQEYEEIGPVGQFINGVLENLEDRLLSNDSNDRSNSSDESGKSYSDKSDATDDADDGAGRFCYGIYSTSREEIVRQEKILNELLKNCDDFNFERIIEAMAWKLDTECRKFLSEDNRARLLASPSITDNISRSCFNMEDRTAWYHRWTRELPHDAPRKFASLPEALEYLYVGLSGLPPYLNNMPLYDFLSDLQQKLVDEAKSQLEITTREGISYINLREELDIDSVVMGDETFNYIYVSLAKQMYFKSSELLGPELIEWIGNQAQEESLGLFGNPQGTDDNDDDESGEDNERIQLLFTTLRTLYP